MVKIRLSRKGRINDPFYRIVVTDGTKSVAGASIEILGYWNPREKKIEINKKSVQEWVKKGAHVSPAVQKLMN